jgi:hypothetical protein
MLKVPSPPPFPGSPEIEKYLRSLADAINRSSSVYYDKSKYADSSDSAEAGKPLKLDERAAVPSGLVKESDLNHNNLSEVYGGDDGDYQHLDTDQLFDLTAGTDASEQHNHESTYYNKEDLYTKTDLYTKDELNGGQLDDRYFTEDEHISSTAGSDDANKPIKTDSSGLIDKTLLENAWPVGSVFISVVDTDPADLLGFGEWVAFGTGKTIVGIDTGDTDFDTVEKTGGSKAHTHTVDPASVTSGAPSATTIVASGTGATVASDTHTHDVDVVSTTSSSSSNVPPYIAVYMWKRTA